MSVVMEILNGYKASEVHGKHELSANESPILENTQEHTARFPVIMYIDERSKGDDILPHVHDAIEILCVISGEIDLFVNNQEARMEKGGIIMLNAYDVHSITGAEARYYVLQVDPHLLSGYTVDLRRYMPQEIDQKLLHASHPLAQELCGLIGRLFCYPPEPPDSQRIDMLSILLTIFARIMAYTEENVKNSGQLQYDQKVANRLKEIFSYVEEHSAEDISLDDIAEHVHLTKTYFCRFFRNMTGTTFVEYLNLYRCKRAEDLMTEPDVSITEIASKVGFKDLSYFNRTYKRLRGAVPSESRRRILKRQSAKHWGPLDIPAREEALKGIPRSNSL